MRKNVDALLIINNERLCDVYSDSPLPIKEAFKRADNILLNATKSISELITVEGDINLDFRDVENTLRSGGIAIMAMGRAKGEHRVENAIVSALDSPSSMAVTSVRLSAYYSISTPVTISLYLSRR